MVESSLKKVSRTEIIVDADRFDEATIKEAWKEVCGDNIATMRIAHEGDGIHLLLYPFKNYEVEYEHEFKMPKPVPTEVSWIRRLSMQGQFPSNNSAGRYYPTPNDIVEDFWKPIRKARGDMRILTPEGQWRELTEAERSDLGHVVMYIMASKNVDCEKEDDSCKTTEMEFCVDNRIYREVEGMTKDQRVVHMLNIAVSLLAESLRKVIEEIDPRILTAAAMMNELSMDLADALEEYDCDILTTVV